MVYVQTCNLCSAGMDDPRGISANKFPSVVNEKNIFEGCLGKPCDPCPGFIHDPEGMTCANFEALVHLNINKFPSFVHQKKISEDLPYINLCTNNVTPANLKGMTCANCVSHIFDKF